MRKQQILLEHIPNATAMCWAVDPLISGKQNFFIQAICPSVGAKAPEIACAIVDFPAPERPNNAVTPDPALNAMSKLNPENWCLMETVSVIDRASVFEHAAPTIQTATKQ